MKSSATSCADSNTKRMSNALKPVGFHDTLDLIQNFCVTFTHSFGHYASNPKTRFVNHFVVRGAPIDSGIALEMTKMMFPTYTDIKIESIENDENTLTPSEYFFLQGVIKEKLYCRAQSQEERKKNNPEIAKAWEEDGREQEYDEYLLNLIKKMQTRMDQFPVYHT
jgi:hypothetical protein